MDTKKVLLTLKDNADNIQSYTIVDGGNHISWNNNGINIGPSLDMNANSPQVRLDEFRSIFVTWKSKATQARNAIKEIEGTKITSFDTSGQNPQDIIGPS
jgi:hypothetical protein